MPRDKSPYNFKGALRGAGASGTATKLTPAAAVTAMTTGRRYGGPEALGAGLVEFAVPDAEVLTKAIELVRPLAGKDPGTWARSRRRCTPRRSWPCNRPQMSPCHDAVNRSCPLTNSGGTSAARRPTMS
ncbi:MAG TPA: hypothetical protein VHI14_07305 [Jatrophihabitantaceae bacterium]|nr:hypothetical protein [Jatrophihabitantaceae bacterium]